MIFIFMMFAYMRIKDNNSELYIYNHDYWQVGLDKYTINYINGIRFYKRKFKKKKDQCKNIIISIIDIYG